MVHLVLSEAPVLRRFIPALWNCERDLWERFIIGRNPKVANTLRAYVLNSAKRRLGASQTRRRGFAFPEENGLKNIMSKVIWL